MAAHLARVLAEVLLHVLEPAEDLLIRKAMQRTRKAIEASGEGEVGVAEGAADEVRRVRAHVAALVVCTTRCG